MGVTGHKPLAEIKYQPLKFSTERFKVECPVCGASIHYVQFAPVHPSGHWEEFVVYKCRANYAYTEREGLHIVGECPTVRPFCLHCKERRTTEESRFCSDRCGRAWADEEMSKGAAR
jgi:hypothetical protein